VPSINHRFLTDLGKREFGAILADPPWRFQNKTGKVAPEQCRLYRYETMSLDEIKLLPVTDVLRSWGFSYKSNIVWHKIRKDGGSDGRGVGFYFRNVTEVLLFGVRGKNARTLDAGRRQVNYLATRKREHSRKPDEQYEIIESCSNGPFLELFARGARNGWTAWGNQADGNYRPDWKTYAYNSVAFRIAAE
jgi:N6-adenosine-specific RNA methylase IME4